MAYRIIAKNTDKLDDIMSDIKQWFKDTDDYVTKFDTETRKFVDPETKKIVSKPIDVLYVKDPATRKETVIKFIPLLKPEEMKVEIGGDNEGPIKGKIKNMMKSRGDLKSYNKDTLRKMENKTMKKSQLQQIIREEIRRALKEAGGMETIYISCAEDAINNNWDDYNSLIKVYPIFKKLDSAFVKKYLDIDYLSSIRSHKLNSYEKLLVKQFSKAGIHAEAVEGDDTTIAIEVSNK